jgi:hypothetical protein
MLGINQVPSTVETEICLVHIKDSYGDMTLEDMKLAVKYSLQGLFEVDATAYNSFSPAYISRILNAYKKYKDRQIYNILKEKEKVEMKEKEMENIDPKESRKRYLQWYFNEIKVKDTYLNDFKDIAFGVMLRFYDNEINLEGFYLQASGIQAKINLEAEKYSKFIRTVKELDDVVSVEKIQRWMYMKNYFENLIPDTFISELTEKQLRQE